MDITNFITWFISQVISIFTWMFSLLDSITFSGTSLLKFSITIVILSTLLPVLLTITFSPSVVQRSEKVKPSERTEEKGVSAHHAPPR